MFDLENTAYLPTCVKMFLCHLEKNIHSVYERVCFKRLKLNKPEMIKYGFMHHLKGKVLILCFALRKES